MTLAAETLAADLGSLRRHAWIGIIAIVFGFGGLCFWAANTDISGAVIAAGQLQVESFAKLIQHQDGGIVKQINVHDDDPVKEGDVLVVLDDTDIRASLGVVTAQLNEAYVEEARLVAQIGGKQTFDLPKTVDANDAKIQSLQATQQQILTAQVADRDGRIAQLNEQIQQLNHQVDGLAMQEDADNKQLTILDQRSSNMDNLLGQGLAQAADTTNLHLQEAAAEGDRGRLIAAIAQTKSTVTEKQAAIDQTQAGFMSQALDDLQKTRQTIAQAEQQKLAGQAKLDRTIIKAPQTGVVHESIVHTVGGVITPGQTIMEIVPSSDTLLVGIHIDPNDIESVHVGQAVNLRFSSLDRRRTPEAWGKIDSVSPDLVVQQQTGRAYYTANVRIDADELAKLPQDIKLIPGIPVQAFVTTGDRSVLSYLVHPLVEEMQLAFREP
jgi:HlyD family secretion protein